MGAPDRTAWPPIGPRAILLGAAVVGALCFGLCVLGFTRPTHKPVSSQIPFTQRVIFDYHAAAHAGLIYPDGVLRTGDPIFVRLVHRIAFEAQYGFTTRASHELSGTKQLSLDVMGPGGWSRSLPLGPRQRFTGTNATMQVTLDLDRVQSLIDRVQSVTGMTLGSGYTVALVPDVRISGTLAGQPIKTAFKPPLTLTFNGLQLQPSLGSASSSGSESGFTARKSAAVSAAGSAPATLTVLGHRMGVGLLRWIGLIGLLLAGLAVLVAALLKRAEPFEEAARIQAEFGHLIVPILVESDDLGWPPVDVPSIKALVRLAESGQCLILHRDDPGGDTYLVNDAGTVYRYQVKPGNVVWGEWKPARPRPLNATSAPDADDLSAQSSSA